MFGIDEIFISMQGDSPFFVFECFLTIYLLVSQGVMSEKFLMASLNNISKNYGLNESITGIMCAIGMAVPELAVTLLSFQRHGIKMTEFGLASTFGSVVFCTTFVPAFAYFINYGITKARPELTESEVEQMGRLKRIFVRDMTFISAGLAMFYVIFADSSINLMETVMLLVLFAVYVIVVSVQHMKSKKEAD